MLEEAPSSRVTSFHWHRPEYEQGYEIVEFNFSTTSSDLKGVTLRVGCTTFPAIRTFARAPTAG